MANEITFHPVYHALNRRLMVMGLERRLLFGIVTLGTMTYAAMGTLLGGVLTTISLYGLARWGTRRDPQYFEILARTSGLPARYDPITFEPVPVVIVRRDGDA